MCERSEGRKQNSSGKLHKQRCGRRRGHGKPPLKRYGREARAPRPADEQCHSAPARLGAGGAARLLRVGAHIGNLAVQVAGHQRRLLAGRQLLGVLFW